MFEITVEKTIACAHYLRGYDGDCARLHGHNYTIRVCLRGARLNDADMLADFGDVKRALLPIFARYDHQTLNDLPAFADINPSTEAFAKVIADELAAHDFGMAELHSVQVQETPTQWATYYL